MTTRLFTISAVCALTFFSCNQAADSKPGTEQEFYEETVQQPVITPEEQLALDEAFENRSETIRKLKERATRDWPNDYTTQEYWVNAEIEAYDYMLTIPDDEIKRSAQRDWPLDFTTQKYWYYEQVEAKERMK